MNMNAMTALSQCEQLHAEMHAAEIVDLKYF